MRMMPLRATRCETLKFQFNSEQNVDKINDFWRKKPILQIC